ncbi:hypothetical protein Tco_0745985, partial [Tanacetum coccineum]
RTPEKLLIGEEAKFPVTKNVNSISLARGEEERSDKTDETLDNTVKPIGTKTKIPVKEAERNNEIKNKPIKKAEEEEVIEVLNSRPVEYYLKHRINEKLIKALVDNNRFNDSLLRARVGKVKGKTYTVLPRWPVYEAILKKNITKKEDIKGNFKIPCSIGGLKHVNAFDKGTITLKSRKSKISSHRRPDSPCMTEKGVKNDIEPIALTMTVNRLVLEWEERIKLHLGREMKFNQ